MPVFLVIITAAALGIFNYQKLSSSVVASVLYALRTSEQAREALGGEIYFRDRVPWVSGTLNQLRGVIDIGFGVKGTGGTGYVRFRSRRRERAGMYETLEWSLELQDGRKIQLLDKNVADPLGGVQHQVAVDDKAAA
jgi:cytochrome c oxidase assembly factor 1